MLTLLDVNNFWSPTGGGVRRYQLEKMRVFAERSDVKHVFVMPGDETRTEELAGEVVIEHLKAQGVPGTGAYRHILKSGGLKTIVQRHRPDAIEVGSPIIMPRLVRKAIADLEAKPAMVGFWHADFPRTYTGLGMRTLWKRLEPTGEKAGWAFCRRQFADFDAIFVASRNVGENMRRHGLDRLYYTPLGVDVETFAPTRRSEEIVQRYRAGEPSRKVIVFPHRFSEEKGIRNLLGAYEALTERMEVVPALVFAGTGPALDLVEASAARFEHVHYLGFVDSREAMAELLASADLVPCLSKFETFGLSAAEAMACGVALVAADEGAAAELVEDSGCGLTVPYGEPEPLAAAIEKLCGEAEALTERGTRGRAHIEPFTWERTFDREVRCYAEIVERKRKGSHAPGGFHLDLDGP